jgi:hypothetical protein
MSAKLAMLVVVVTLFGSTSMVLAASRANQHHHHRAGQASSTTFFKTRDPAPSRLWSVCATDDGQGRMRPCDGAGG